MRSRSLLHLTKLAAFKAFCASRGWREEPIKGPYEVLRMTRAGSPTLIVYTRNTATEHCTVHGIALEMTRAFLRERSRSELTINQTQKRQA